jgi:hypothetical protein
MNNNPFSTDALVPNWAKASEILKGDSPGHPFHGNQYESGGGESSHEQAASEHIAAAQSHLKEAEKARTGDDFAKVRANEAAAAAHRKASQAQSQAGRLKASIGQPSSSVLFRPVNEKQYKEAADKAQKLSDSANKYSEMLAQRASIAKSFGEIAKGDQPGHPFHGNQWTGGKGSTVDSTRAKAATAHSLTTKFSKDFYPSHRRARSEWESVAQQHVKQGETQAAQAAKAIADLHRSDAIEETWGPEPYSKAVYDKAFAAYDASANAGK